MGAINPNFCKQAHAPIALRLRCILHNIVPLDQFDIGPIAAGQFKSHHEFGYIHPVLDEPPAGTALLVGLVQQSPPDIVAVLAQQPGAWSRQAIDQWKRSFIEQPLLDLAEEALDIFVLPQRQQRPRHILWTAAVKRGELLTGGQSQSREICQQAQVARCNPKRPRLFRSFK